MRKVTTILMAAVLAVALSGCGGQEPQPQAPARTAAEPTMETTAMETTAMEETTAAEGAAGYEYGEPSDPACLDRQFAAATQGMSPEEAAQYETEVIDEAVQREMDPRDVLAERGFPC